MARERSGPIGTVPGASAPKNPGAGGFTDGGTVKKFVPAPPAIDRPAMGPKSVDNQNVSTYHGSEGTQGAHPSSPMPGPGGPDVILSPITSNLPQETE